MRMAADDDRCCICHRNDDLGDMIELSDRRFHNNCLQLLYHSRRNMGWPVCWMDRTSLDRLADAHLVLDPCAMVTRARVLITDATFVLLVQERNHIWNLPGGGLEERDRRLQSRPALQNCAHREVWEETGLALQHLEWMGCVEGQAVYVARFQYLSWSMIVTAFRHRRHTNEIRRVWWGALEDALGRPGIDSRTAIAMTMLRSQSD